MDTKMYQGYELWAGHIKSAKAQTSSPACSDALPGSCATPHSQAHRRERWAEGTLTEAADRGDVVRGKCNEGWVERLVLLLMVQDFRFAAKKTIRPQFI